MVVSFIKRPETVKLTQSLLFYVLWRKHLRHLLSFIVYDYEGIESAKLWHSLNQKLPISFDLGAWIALQGQISKLL